MTQLLADLIEAGTPAHLVAEVAMLLAKAEVADQRRASDRARQQAKRDRDSNDSHVTSRDVTDCHNIALPPPCPPLDKETPPTPPKEINPPPIPPQTRVCASGDAPPKSDESSLRPDHVVEAWNSMASRIGKPSVRQLTPQRRQMVKARIAQHELDDFYAVFGKLEASPFLRGDTERWPKGATFDWLMKQSNFLKVLEGNYD